MTERFNLDGNPGDSLTKAATGVDIVAIGAGASLKFDNSQMAHGTTSAALKGATGTATYLQLTRSGTTGALVIYWNPGAVLPNALIRLGEFRNATGTIIRLQTTTGNKFQVQEGAGATTAYTVATAFQVNTWYRLELVLSDISATAAAYKFDYYLLDSGSPVEAGISKTSGNVGTTPINNVRIGSSASSTFTGTSYFDDIALNIGSTTYIGALPSTGVTYQAGPCDSSGDGFGAQTSYTYQAVADSSGDVSVGSGSPTPPSVTYFASPCDSSGDVFPASWSVTGNVTIVIPPTLTGDAEILEITGIVTIGPGAPTPPPVLITTGGLGIEPLGTGPLGD